MSRRARSVLVTVALLAAASCSVTPPMPELPPSHPASPAADEAPERAPSSTLRMPVRKPRGAVDGNGAGHGR